MTLPTIGKVEKVALREIWKREDFDFTRWLAQHIDHLNEALGFNVAVETIEENVGPYRVDIYGEDTAGDKVIIENQLEKTDHSHLGQILTYLVNLDARTAIWITADPVEEHRQVIEWLNEITPDDTRFFLVRVEAIRIGREGPVAPLFTLVEGPTVERKKIGAEKKEHAHRHTVRQKFWEQFIAAMNQRSGLCQNISAGTDAWIGIALGVAGIGLNLVVTSKYARAEIFINRGDQARNKVTFDALLAQRASIEASLGNQLTWDRMDDKVTSRIKLQLDGVDVFQESDWPRMNEFLIDAATRMHAAFKDPVQRVRQQERA